MTPLGSTGRQVAALVVVSLLLSHLVFFIIMTIDRQPRMIHSLDNGPALATVARLYDIDPGARPALRDAAARTGIVLTEISSQQAATCHPAPGATTLMQWLVRFFNPPHGEFPYIHCDPNFPTPFESVIRVNNDMWLSATRSHVDMRFPPPPAQQLPMQIVLWIGLPTLLISLFASNLVTRPVRRLAQVVDMIDVEQSKIALLPVQGAIEIRQLADSFNRLIMRLQRFVTDQRRMIAGISHDLRTPLTRLRLRAEQIETAEIRTKMLRDIEMMQLLVENSLSLISAQENQISKTPIDVAVLLHTIADEYADSGRDVSYTGPLHYNFSCDKMLMTRAVENIVDNALKFAGAAEMIMRVDGKYLMIEVTDRGPGMSAADKQGVFEPFYRGDVSRGGAVAGHGLGLSISKAVVQGHGGMISLHDVAPSGLLVRLSFPLLPPLLLKQG